MIPPREQWCVQIEVTNACPRACSNCTRMTAHVREPFYMSLDQFEEACYALADFPAESTPNPNAGAPRGRKCVGMIGGEPQIHPEFPGLVSIMERVIPRRRDRGLWTGVHLDPATSRKFGYINHNQHDSHCVHQPVLVGVQEVVRDEEQMWGLINQCELQRQWSSSITPKGFFFCEVAAALDMVFDGPGGVPVTPGCWRHDLAFYRDQIERWCPRCGVCLPLTGRPDDEERDDISPANLEALRTLGSPRVLAGDCVVADVDRYTPPGGAWEPLRYLRG